MTTITKERIELFIKNPLENGLTRGEQMELARIALEALTAEPVAEVRARYPLGIDGGKQKFIQVTGELPDFGGHLYAVPPATVSVPDGLKQAVEFYEQVKQENIPVETGAWKDAVNWVLDEACRATMLQGAEPVSQTYNLPELIEGMEVSIDVSTCDADAGNRYFGTVTEVSELDTAKNGYILLVQDAEPNFDVNGNSPVIPEDLRRAFEAVARLNNEMYRWTYRMYYNSSYVGEPEGLLKRNIREIEHIMDSCRATMLQANQRDLSQPVDPQVAEYEQIMLQAGWVMVPVEPTEEMIAAAMECDDVVFDSKDPTAFCVQFREIYCAMVDAAPKPEAGPCTK
ncbi:hypothetical protein [Salmonella enterica]|uniref:hypothetical protein n=1 Tax=Salmonella enterica TaxID=28901 RepID=UPI002117B387|nr:hypothetical protein [Salmonella enterica]